MDGKTSDSDGGLCQYALYYEEEALARGRDPTVPGTTVNATNLNSGKLTYVQQVYHAFPRY